MEVSSWLVSWFITYLGDLQPTYKGVIIHLLSTMDIPVQYELLAQSLTLWEDVSSSCPRWVPMWVKVAFRRFTAGVAFLAGKQQQM